MIKYVAADLLDKPSVFIEIDADEKARYQESLAHYNEVIDGLKKIDSRCVADYSWSQDLGFFYFSYTRNENIDDNIMNIFISKDNITVQMYDPTVERITSNFKAKTFETIAEAFDFVQKNFFKVVKLRNTYITQLNILINNLQVDWNLLDD